MKVEVYQSPDGDLTAIDASHKQKQLIVEENSKLIETIEGETWEDCMVKYNKIMGWETYEPMDSVEPIKKRYWTWKKIVDILLIFGIVLLAVLEKDGWGWLVFLFIIKNF